MPVRRTRPKKIRKVVKILDDALAAATQVNETLHTVTDPSTTKRFLVNLGIGEDGFGNNDYMRWGLCITAPGETVPTLADVETEENRWLLFEQGIAQGQAVGQNINRDTKIQRKVKDGDVITIAMETKTVGHCLGSVTIFLDET